ncbi:unnamed protein product [Brassica napus]|uniref:(rape) hypothetical protein n=1 Tax=Brassica napus TaxID=3708 RepID=A0A816YW61_BRANA|nr:unnamed protein product [Brassica napus]
MMASYVLALSDPILFYSLLLNSFLFTICSPKPKV